MHKTNLINKKETLAVVGLGYVGMPLAVAFAQKGLNVIGFDINKKKIKAYQDGKDPTQEVGDDILKKTKVHFTSNGEDLKKAQFIIIAVPTPVCADETPDLEPVISASMTVGKMLQKGSIVVYESTVYPGATEEVCVPVLEKYSKLKYGEDFKVGYSPERINPGDKVHRLDTIVKVVSGMDKDTLDEIKDVYDLVVSAGTFPVSNIKTAEAIKVVENSQRDINVAFMNELAIVFDKMGIDTGEVVDGMNTKWNALKFTPGLVGGHCIGVDPYYFIYQANKLGYHSQIIINGRHINDSMGKYIADAAIKKMIEAGQTPKYSKVVVMGLTFKENCPDIRNSKVADIIKRLNEYGIKPRVTDPSADSAEVKRTYNVKLTDLKTIDDADCVIMAVAHDEYKNMSLNDITKLFGYADLQKKVLVDVKGLFKKEELEKSGLTWWKL